MPRRSYSVPKSFTIPNRPRSSSLPRTLSLSFRLRNPPNTPPPTVYEPCQPPRQLLWWTNVPIPFFPKPTSRRLTPRGNTTPRGNNTPRGNTTPRSNSSPENKPSEPIPKESIIIKPTLSPKPSSRSSTPISNPSIQKGNFNDKRGSSPSRNGSNTMQTNLIQKSSHTRISRSNVVPGTRTPPKSRTSSTSPQRNSPLHDRPISFKAPTTNIVPKSSTSQSLNGQVIPSPNRPVSPNKGVLQSISSRTPSPSCEKPKLEPVASVDVEPNKLRTIHNNKNISPRTKPPPYRRTESPTVSPKLAPVDCNSSNNITRISPKRTPSPTSKQDTPKVSDRVRTPSPQRNNDLNSASFSSLTNSSNDLKKQQKPPPGYKQFGDHFVNIPTLQWKQLETTPERSSPEILKNKRPAALNGSELLPDGSFCLSTSYSFSSPRSPASPRKPTPLTAAERLREVALSILEAPLPFELDNNHPNTSNIITMELEAYNLIKSIDEDAIMDLNKLENLRSLLIGMARGSNPQAVVPLCAKLSQFNFDSEYSTHPSMIVLEVGSVLAKADQIKLALLVCKGLIKSKGKSCPRLTQALFRMGHSLMGNLNYHKEASKYLMKAHSMFSSLKSSKRWTEHVQQFGSNSVRGYGAAACVLRSVSTALVALDLMSPAAVMTQLSIVMALLKKHQDTNTDNIQAISFVQSEKALALRLKAEVHLGMKESSPKRMLSEKLNAMKAFKQALSAAQQSSNGLGHDEASTIVQNLIKEHLPSSPRKRRASADDTALIGISKEHLRLKNANQLMLEWSAEQEKDILPNPFPEKGNRNKFFTPAEVSQRRGSL
eukprot:NODE_481_length_2696_cov_40.386708_g412_i0.p1 GENE.NODE_481_length_2696_cov_40.386708_g412_i0~~NODE_481_length_2696_cov_40.386708_g412_i0.p1  ORF type:complete len:856 (-),score=201.28 NODE_481_length_2696_cov_40.386708_g412_i0:129-2606(-)